MLPTGLLAAANVYPGDIRQTFPAWLRVRSYSRVFVLADSNTRRHCLPYFQSCLDTVAWNWVDVPAGEIHKTLSTCAHIWQAMLEARLDRSALVVNLGGGVIGDMGGFCAATYKRGTDFVQVPTTLLAMTDAAIGGKVGVDFQGIKNVIGVFRMPAAVFADPAFLKTLPERELRSGFAEVVKHGCIGEPAWWSQLAALPAGFESSWHTDDWTALLERSIAVKLRVVAEDPLEKGLRAVLNFGHTIGHALESYFLNTADPLTHGEAVAIGMYCETGAAGLEIPQLDAVILRHFPKRHLPEAAFPALWALMQQDKKNAADTVRMALPGNAPFSLRLLELSAAAMEAGIRGYNALIC